jgi:hypothetical protein
VALTTGGHPTAAPMSASAPDVSTSSWLYTSGDITIPAGTANEVSIVLVGPVPSTFTGGVDIVIHNNTDDRLYDIDVTGFARDANGSLVAATGDFNQVLTPIVLQPSEWGVGHVGFDTDTELGPNLQYEWVIQTSTQPPEDLNVMMAISEASHVDDRIVGIIQNPTNIDTEEFWGGVTVACFSEGGTELLGTVARNLNVQLPPYGSKPFTVQLDGLDCPTWAVGVDAWPT